jgi:two-component system response regulator ResD
MNNRIQKKLLLADNSAEYRRSVRGFLELEEFIVDEAGTLEDALGMLETQQFDLVLADLRMRDDTDADDMSGLAIAKFASESGIPCIIVTAFPSVELARKALRARGAEPLAQDLITKATGPHALIDAISLTLREHKPPHSLAQTRAYPLGMFLENGLVYINGELVRFSKNQYALLEELHKKDGGVCTYVDLMLAIYGEKINGNAKAQDKRLRNLVDRTSEKIDDEDHRYIEAVPGRGYRLNRKR